MNCPNCGKETTLDFVANAVEEPVKPKSKPTKVIRPKLESCWICQGLVSYKARTCPHCGHPFTNPSSFGEVLSIVFRVILSLIILGTVLAIILGFILLVLRN